MTHFEKHVAVLAFPFGTHVAPLLALVKNLAAYASHVKFSFFGTSSSNQAVAAGNIQTYSVWDGTPSGRPFSGTHLEAMGLFLDASPKNFEEVISTAEEETGLRVSCFLTDAFLWFGCDLAEERGVPWVSFWTAALCSLSAHMHTDSVLDDLGSPGADEEGKVTIPGLSMARFTDLPPEIFHIQNPSSLAVTIYKMVQKLPKSTAVVLNSFEEIDPIITKDLKSRFQHLLNIGPLLLTSQHPRSPENECLSWLDGKKPNSVVYISFGTVIAPPENELIALAEALETCKFPFLWSLKDEAVKLLPGGFRESTKEHGKIVSWAPQIHVLAHNSVGVFVTHCGWNSILESISNGVPMICRPFFGDQRLNCRMVEDAWKIGKGVKGGVFTKTDTIEALKSVMSSQAIHENIHALKDRAIEALESERGSSTKNFRTLLKTICGKDAIGNGTSFSARS